MSDELKQLAAPFPPERISWRVGSTTADKTRGMALAYIDARDVQDRLDEVCGVLWQVRTPWCVNGRIACEIGIKMGDDWIWRGDGAGETDVEADKGAFSDAFKRAAVRWGIGRYLYDIESPWVTLKPAGKSWAIADNEYERLRKLLAVKGAALARPALPTVAPLPAPVAAPLAAKAPDELRAEAKRIETEMKTADNLHKLDLVMDLNRATLNMLPKVTQDYLTKYYERHREAMESVT